MHCDITQRDFRRLKKRVRSRIGGARVQLSAQILTTIIGGQFAAAVIAGGTFQLYGLPETGIWIASK
jgi:hypothetical protein